MNIHLFRKLINIFSNLVIDVRGILNWDISQVAARDKVLVHHVVTEKSSLASQTHQTTSLIKAVNLPLSDPFLGALGLYLHTIN